MKFFDCTGAKEGEPALPPSAGVQLEDEVAMLNSFGQRSVPFTDLNSVAGAVCRIDWYVRYIIILCTSYASSNNIIHLNFMSMTLNCAELNLEFCRTDKCSNFRLFCVCRTGNLGSGTFVNVHKTEHSFLLTCCHNFLDKNERAEREKMKRDDLKATLTNNCKEAKFEVTVENSLRPLTAKAVLLDCENPVLCFDQVQQDPAKYNIQPLYHMLNM